MAIIPYENIYRSGNQVDELYRSGNEIVKMYRSGDLIYQKLSSAPDDSIIPLTFEIITSGTILWKKYTNSAPDRTIQYRINNGSWESIAANDTAGTAINVSVGDIVQFKGNNASYSSTNYYGQACQFGGTATFYAYGNIMSLIYGDNFIGQNTLEENYTFVGLFRSLNGLTSHIAHKLIMPATTLTNSCYSNMFYGTNITTAPELPATNLTVACYLNMFCNTPLISAPQLPATTLTQSCYNSMFSFCTNLTTAPELPATTLVESCYNFMFAHCSSLNYVKCLATDISATDCAKQWLDSVAENGTFIKDSAMSSWPSGINGIPAGWTVQNA